MSRVQLIKKLSKEGRQDTWADLAVEYGAKDDKQANDWWRWFLKHGEERQEWAPGVSMVTMTVEEEEDEIVDPESYLEPSEDVTKTRQWQEFLDWQQAKRHDQDFIPGTYVVAGCIHAPFHNKTFVNAALNLITDLQPEGLVLAGDILDNNSLSAHERGKIPLEGVTLDWEYEQTNLLLDQFDNAAEYKVKHYVYGNHEDRYFRHMKGVNASKYGEALKPPTKGLRLKERGYRVQENWKDAVVYLGKHLEVSHGEYCNIHTAKKHIDTFRTSIMYVHTHRVQTYIEGNVGGFNIGWMGDVNSKAFGYAGKGQKAKWNNGFAVVEIDEEGNYHPNIIMWQNDRFYYGGKVYK